MKQTETILRHLQEGPITGLEALDTYGIFRLASRISDLRKSGHKIKTEMIKRNGKQYAMYTLEDDSNDIPPANVLSGEGLLPEVHQPEGTTGEQGGPDNEGDLEGMGEIVGECQRSLFGTSGGGHS